MAFYFTCNTILGFTLFAYTIFRIVLNLDIAFFAKLRWT